MRTGLISVAAFAMVLSGCVTTEMFVKQGVTMDRYERDTVGCATKVTQAVPTNTQVAWAPYVGIYSVDTNSGLRSANLDICMRDKGYQKRPVPYCQGDIMKDATAAAAMPPDSKRRLNITADTCYVNRADGRQFIYTPK
jgi:hypothetical protein